MKIEIQKKVETTEILDIDLPYYYKQIILLDTQDLAVFGRIEENNHIAITIRSSYGEHRAKGFGLEIEHRRAHTLGCYMVEKYRSNETEYLAAKAETLAAMYSV